MEKGREEPAEEVGQEVAEGLQEIVAAGKNRPEADFKIRGSDPLYKE